MTKLKSPVKEALKFREKIYIDLGSHWTLKSCLWGRPEKSLGTPDIDKCYGITYRIISDCFFFFKWNTWSWFIKFLNNQLDYFTWQC